MDQMSLLSFLTVSIPEELLIAITAVSLAGYLEVLNFKSRQNIIRLSGSVLLMSVISTLCRTLLPMATLNLVIMLFVFPCILFIIYRQKNPIPIVLGSIISLVIIVVVEALVSPLMLSIFNLSFEEGLVNDNFRIIVTVPERMVQLILIYIICRARKINLSMAKFALDEWIRFILFGLMIVSSLISIESGLKNMEHDFKTMLHLIINICFAIIFSSWMAYNILKMRKRTILNEKLRDFELQRISKLLHEGYTDHVIELIDAAIKEGR